MPQFVCRTPRNDGGVRRDIVNDADHASRHQHAERLTDETADLAEVMRGKTADDEIEIRIGKGKVLGLGGQSLDIGEATGLRKPPRLAKHLLGDVGGGDLGDMRGKGERGVARAGRHVEYAPMRLWLGELNEALKTCALGVHLGGGVVSRRSAKSLLGPGFRQSSMEVADVDETAGKRSSRRHHRRDEMGTAEPALAALEIAVRGRGAALAGRKLIG